MKKLKMGIVCFVMGAIVLSGCGKAADTSASKDSSSQVESSESSTKESTKKSTEKSTEQSTEKKSGNSSTFSLMIEGAQSQIPSLKEQYAGMYSDISITEGEDSTIVYTYVFAEAPEANIDAEALKPTLVKGLKPVMDTAKVAIPDIKIQVIFLNPDQSEVINFLITQDDTDNVDSAQ
ncbi:hypothetical protein UAY_03340 [Enterococcus moraviensis ATCC BAA-383]|uniref:Lipoprotein n=1 Tax=Enterococcus moraviensis ATCC BAA-383 TaxID=1158609 RepID=R2T6P0_9ENTE|nr:hypothetical protein [Enterococcus moraviensis]EOH95914.1 hypothetical protein UAY_03340 [Enterococcus moraviensis ATCC BAA-383]EOT66401.1 hypothetical protein I586_02672 [Enterococcus moraviensis ATCC BAA-383]